MGESERDFRDVLRTMVQMGASDLHLKCGSPPTLRVDGTLFHLDEPKCSPKELERLIEDLLPTEKASLFRAEQECDVAVSVPGLARFRVNLCWQRGSIGASFRLVPTTIPNLAELGIPPILGSLIAEKRGLILITGSTGAGKREGVAAYADRS